MKMPYLKFFTRDWLSCPEIRMCSYAARGLWIDMLCLMATSERYGYLIAGDGSPMTAGGLARLTGGEAGEVAALLDEMRGHGVYDVDGSGAIVSRRMVRDDAVRKACSRAGRMGGGSPLLTPPSSEDRTHNPEPITQNPQIVYTPPLNPPFKGLPEFEEPDGWTTDQVIECGRLPTVACGQKDAEDCHAFYSAQGWVKAGGVKVGRTWGQLGGLLRTWKNNAPSFRKRQETGESTEDTFARIRGQR